MLSPEARGTEILQRVKNQQGIRQLSGDYDPRALAPGVYFITPPMITGQDVAAFLSLPIEAREVQATFSIVDQARLPDYLREYRSQPAVRGVITTISGRDKELPFKPPTTEIHQSELQLTLDDSVETPFGLQGSSRNTLLWCVYQIKTNPSNGGSVINNLQQLQLRGIGQFEPLMQYARQGLIQSYLERAEEAARPVSIVEARQIYRYDRSDRNLGNLGGEDEYIKKRKRTDTET